MTIRIAAVGDVHVGLDSRGRLAPWLAEVGTCADVLLLAGDLTQVGRVDEAEVLVGELAEATVPVIAVLGNHDLHSDLGDEVAGVLEAAGVTVLEGGTAELTVGDTSLGVAGVAGFGGGFPGRTASAFGEPEMKAFVRRTVESASRLEHALCLARHRRARRPDALLARAPTRWGGSRSRSTPSSAATCWPRPSTTPGPTWCSTGMRTAAASRG